MFKKSQGENLSKNAVGFFQGASAVPLYSSDVNYPEYQEAFFYYLFGVFEMDCFGIIDFVNEKATVFVPRLDNNYKIWMTLLTIEDYKKRYPLLDNIMFTDQIEEYFKS